MAKMLDVTNPYTEETAFTLPMLSLTDVDAVVRSARTAFAEWRWATAAERRALCNRFVDAFDGDRDEIAKNLAMQMGRPIKHAYNEVNGTLDRARHMIAIAEDTLKDEYLPEKTGFVRYIRHEPLGVALDIAAWNYPLLIAVNVVVPAVLAGNAVIIKHSSRTPLCGHAFVEAFQKAGAPAGLVQDIYADHAVTEAFIQHPGVNYVSFTGSVRGGHEVVRSAKDKFINVGLELGGKDPAYVCADAPFEFAVANIADGVLYNAGQSCCAVERIYVEKPIYERFLDAYIEETKKYAVMGDPLDVRTTLGPMATKSAPAFLEQQVKEAVARGGRLLVPFDAFEKPAQGWFCAPAVVADAPQDCSLMQEESFGPVIGILPVLNDDDAVRMMNDSPYGLTASVWTSDLERARRIGARVETGTFFMNRCDYLDPALPWTGVKDTGKGASLSHYGLLQLTQLKSMHLRAEIPG